MTCPVCKGTGLVRIRWNERVEYTHNTNIYHRYKDAWCKGCGGKGFRKKGDK